MILPCVHRLGHLIISREQGKEEWKISKQKEPDDTKLETVATKADEGPNSTVAVADGLADRIAVPLGAFAVNIDPVSAGDSGDYVCLVNNRRRPNAVIRLLVQGGPPRKFVVLEWRTGNLNGLYENFVAAINNRHLRGRAFLYESLSSSPFDIEAPLPHIITTLFSLSPSSLFLNVSRCV